MENEEEIMLCPMCKVELEDGVCPKCGMSLEDMNELDKKDNDTM